MKRRFLLFLLLAFGLSACQVEGIAERKKAVKLRDTLNRYEVVVRWGALEKAYGFLVPELNEDVVIPAGLDNIRVTGYDLLGGPSKLSEDRVTQTVRIDYVLQDSQVVRSLADKQIWQWNDEIGDWQRANPVPELK